MSKGDIFLENDFLNNFHKLEYKIFSISFENNLEEYVKWKTVTNSSHVEKNLDNSESSAYFQKHLTHSKRQKLLEFGQLP